MADMADVVGNECGAAPFVPFSISNRPKAGEIEREVDQFKAFYSVVFPGEIIAKSKLQLLRKYHLFLVLSAALGALLLIPFFLTPGSAFAQIMLVFAFLGFAYGGYCLMRLRRMDAYCEANEEKIVADSFSEARSSAWRNFDIEFDVDGISISYGAKGTVRRRRERKYSDITALYVTQHLLYIKGVTWLCRSAIDPEDAERVQNALSSKGVPVLPV